MTPEEQIKQIKNELQKEPKTYKDLLKTILKIELITEN